MSEPDDFTHLDDPAFLDARARLHRQLEQAQEDARGRPELERQFEAMTLEFLRRARVAWTSATASAVHCSSRQAH